MDFDYGWGALLVPGDIQPDVFDIPDDCDIQGVHRFQPHRAAYHAVNAWWLGELSRLIYKQEDDETEDPAHVNRRKNALKAVHLQEVMFFNSL